MLDWLVERQVLLSTSSTLRIGCRTGGRDGKPNTEYIQLVLNKILFIIGDTVKDDNVKKIISQKLYELGNEAEVKVPKQVSIDGEYLPKQLRRTVVNDPTSKNGNVELKPVEGVVVK